MPELPINPKRVRIRYFVGIVFFILIFFILIFFILIILVFFFVILIFNIRVIFEIFLILKIFVFFFVSFLNFFFAVFYIVGIALHGHAFRRSVVRWVRLHERRIVFKRSRGVVPNHVAKFVGAVGSNICPGHRIVSWQADSVSL